MIFFRFNQKEKYKTWQEASEVCQKLGITNYKEAQLRVSGLPTNPNIFGKIGPEWVCSLVNLLRNIIKLGKKHRMHVESLGLQQERI